MILFTIVLRWRWFITIRICSYWTTFLLSSRYPVIYLKITLKWIDEPFFGLTVCKITTANVFQWASQSLLMSLAVLIFIKYHYEETSFDLWFTFLPCTIILYKWSLFYYIFLNYVEQCRIGTLGLHDRIS